MSDPLLIAFTGSWGSGCTTAVDYLTENRDGNNEYISVSISTKIEELLKQIEKEGNPAEKLGDTFNNVYEGDLGRVLEKAEKGPADKKEALQDIGNALREKNGGAYLIEELKESIDKNLSEGKSVIIDQIKNLAEHFFLEGNFRNYYLVNINASYENRLKRHPDIPENRFFELDDRDAHESQPRTGGGGGRINNYAFGQQVSKCVDAADLVVLNNIHGDAGKEKYFNYIKTYFEFLHGVDPNRSPQPQEMFMTAARNISLKSNCLKRKVGAVIIKDNYIVSSGYNDVPVWAETCAQKYKNCYRDKLIVLFEEVEWRTKPPESVRDKNEFETVFRKHLDLCRAIHAEERAIIQTAKLGGVSLTGTVLYTTLFPCQLCAKKIIEVGIKKVVYCEPYPYKEAKDMLLESGVTLEEFHGVKAKAFFKLYEHTRL